MPCVVRICKDFTTEGSEPGFIGQLNWTVFGKGIITVSARLYPTARGEELPRLGIRMADAIKMERILTSGKYSSANQFAMALGVSQTLVSNRLKMLNLPPDEIERILFEPK